MKNRPLTYLAVPYSHPDRAVRTARFNAVNRAAGMLMRWGEHVFSPISHTHPIVEACRLPFDFDHWEPYNRAVLSCCHKLIVLKLDGWRESVGVQAEIKAARGMGIYIEFLFAYRISTCK